MHIRLVKKLASFLNGVDLTHRRVGDRFDCSDAVARMLILESWAEPAETSSDRVLSKDLSPIANEEPSHSVSEIIDHHRDGRKDKLTPQEAD